MTILPRSLYSVAQVREMDRSAIEKRSIPGYELMTRAGQATLDEIRRRYPDIARMLIVCGAGNNAGDGFVIARLARRSGIAVDLVTAGDPGKLKNDAARAYKDFGDAGGTLAQHDFEALFEGADLIVDALLGTGLERDVSGHFARLIEQINASAVPVVSVDIPSGIDGDTGHVRGIAVLATVTVSFVGLKQGLFLDAGPEHCGELVFNDLGIPAAVADAATASLIRLDAADPARWLPRRPRSAHKGMFGHGLIVGGSPGMGGAARLAGEACLRGGAGLVSLATWPEHAVALIAGRPELMCHGVTDASDLSALIEPATALGVGPGLGTSERARSMLRTLIDCALPLVADADALNLLAQSPERNAHWILTPHPGEAARLLKWTTAEVQHDRPRAVRALAERYGGVVVLKGAGTLIHRVGATPRLCPYGNPGMATPGMGDVLTGLVVAMLAQRLDPLEAASAAVLVHALAGDAAAQRGERGLIAGDLIDGIRQWVN